MPNSSRDPLTEHEDDHDFDVRAAEDDSGTEDKSLPDRFFLPRLGLLLYNTVLLIYLCQHRELGQVNNQIPSVWMLIPVLLIAGVAAGLGTIFIGPAAGIWLGGVAGFAASFLGLDGPYSAVLGIVTAVNVELIYFTWKARFQASEEEA